MADEPNWLILDDTFAALDPAMREIVAKKILASVPNCTLLASSEEYVPDALANRLSLTHRELSLGQLHAEQITSQELGSLEEVVDLPDPQTEKATFQRTLKLLFGPHIVWVGLGALLLSGSTVAFALTVAQNNLHSEIVGVSLGCILAAVLGSIIFFGALYRAPITRLTTLHERLVYRLDQFASPRTSGAVVGRLGEDFSDLQMSVPGAVGSVFLVWVQSALLIAGAVAGAPLFIVVVCAVAPLAWLVGRQGSKWILPASTACANARGEFIGVVSAQANAHTAPVSVGLRQAGERAYVDLETSYVANSIQLADAYALRSGLIQLLVLTLKISAVLLVSLSGGASVLIAPAAVIYFALTLSSGLQSVVETLQEVGVVSLTAERVRMLEEFQTKRSQVRVRHAELEQLKSLIDSGCSLIALIGPTGAGKSVMLDALYR
ncbi:MAG: ABC transporter ATP-binding protein, partial [Actinomyces graevenitzii]|nr:ABC transporter ATP-binding protein [Actinomyces graevenitzii]